MTEQSPKIDGVEATFRHVDDIEWTGLRTILVWPGSIMLGAAHSWISTPMASCERTILPLSRS